MPRKPRLDAPGTIHHLISRGNNKQALFHDDSDFMEFIRLLAQTKRMIPFKLYAHALMPNHFHLLVQRVAQPTSIFMHRLLTCYSHYFNRRYGHVGHVFQDRYKAILCTRDSYFHSLRSYIHNNQVRGGLVVRPEDWPWSGLGQHGCAMLDQASELLLFDEEDPSPNTPDSETPKTKDRTLEQLAQAAALRTRVPLILLRGPRRLRRLTPARRLFAESAIADGHTIAEMARFLNRAESSVAAWLEHHQ